MSSFVDILTVFKGAEDRTVSNLSHVYEDDTRLINSIESIIARNLKRNLIENKRILLKPNWVNHSRKKNDEICLRTNDRFLLATLIVILKMKPSYVLIGDAPIQGCDWNRVATVELLQEIRKLSVEYHIQVQVKDFRRRIYDFTQNNITSEIRSLEEYVIFDLGKGSLLEPITTPGKSNFRVTNYDPDRMSSAHYGGVHKYCIAKELFESDTIISLAKVKTHQKVGITCALKNLVGFNGDKDFLPHHRIGGTKINGDCYPGKSYLRYWAELSLDNANRRQGRKSFWFWHNLASVFWRLSNPGPEHQIAAGWYGNDTTWRMVYDLNRIVEFGTGDGVIHNKQQRQIFTLCDGIIGGQGNGPLEPEPLPLGIISFSNSSLNNDRVVAKLMGMPVKKIPLISSFPFGEKTAFDLRLNEERVTLEQLKYYSIKAIPPEGWVKFLTATK